MHIYRTIWQIINNCQINPAVHYNNIHYLSLSSFFECLKLFLIIFKMPMWQKMKGLNYNTKPLATFYFLVFKVKIVLANSV